MKLEIEKAVEVLKSGGVIVYPTETLYGLGADVFNEAAVKKIYELKGRDFNKPLSIAVLKEEVGKYAEVNEKAQELIDKYLPGPLTLVLKKKEIVPAWVTDTEYVGIRVPDEESVLEIIRQVGPIASTSANLSGGEEPVKVEQIPQSILDGVDLVIDGGTTKENGPSTVVKVENGVEVLRRGVLKLCE
ncbi:MAG: L-threonylcarbamoyladenylate synthase [archaeon]